MTRPDAAKTRTLTLLLLLTFCAGPDNGRPATAMGAPQGQALSRRVDVVPVVLLRRSSKPLPAGATGDVLAAADLSADALASRAQQVMTEPNGFAQLALRLDLFARTYLLRDPALPAERRAALERPAYLFLSDRQGGFPVEGFWLEAPDGSLAEMRDAPFVDMVVEERDLAPASIDGLEAIYAHELGHLVMAALAGPAPRKASSAVHFTTVRTDAWSAFVEGWGEHFQPMAVDHSAGGGGRRAVASDEDERLRFWYDRFAGEQLNGCWICPANLRFLRWQQPGEQRLRDDGLRANLFMHQPALPAELLDGRSPYDVRMYRDIVPPRPDGPLKNAAQALSSEGVLATFFYRLANDPRLRSSYREPGFYRPFLPDGLAADLASLGPQAVVTPVENVYLKVFHVLHTAFSWGDWPAIEFVSGYASTFPDEAPFIYDVFLDVTRGVTVERAAAERNGEPGYLAGVRDALLAGKARLDGNTAPPLWLATPGFTLAMGVFRYFPVPSTFTLDLNAADTADLLSLPGVTASLAASIVAAREKAGGFRDVQGLAGVQGVTPELLSDIAAMRKRMLERQARVSPGRERGNPTWMMNWLATVLKGSYHAAAAWQFGSAAVLAGLAYLLAAALAARLSSSRRMRADKPRRWWRRGAGALARGAAVAAVPLAASAGLYAAGIVPGPGSMALVGLAYGLGLAALHATRTGAAGRAAAALGPLTGSIAASVLIGWMY